MCYGSFVTVYNIDKYNYFVQILMFEAAIATTKTLLGATANVYTVGLL